MKERILNRLKADADYVSGESISNLLGISRTAVWKHINSLKTDGYLIESLRNHGHRLISIPDKLYPAEIKPWLKTTDLGREIIYYDAVDSTNRAAREEADLGRRHGGVVIADLQTAGRGRLGRRWFSPGLTGIWLSVILRPDIIPADAPKITLAAAVAVAGALAEAGLSPGIKWPNDILLQGKKVCGIYTEMKADMDRVQYVVVGIGINVNERSFPEEIQTTATSLCLAGEREFPRPQIAAAVLNHLETVFGQFLDQGFAGVRQEWKKYAINLGRQVEVNTLQKIISGRAVDIDENGLLLVESADGVLHRITAGDVTLRRE